MEEHVVRLEVAVDDALGVQIGDCLADLAGGVSGLAVRGGAGAVFDVLAEGRIEGALHDCVEVEEVVEEAVDLDHVGMAEVLLYLDLSDELLDHVAVPYFPLGHDLDGDQGSRLPLHGQHHSPEGALAQVSHDHEALNAEPAALLGHLDWVDAVPVTLETVQEGRKLLLGTLVLRLLPQVLELGDFGQRTGVVGVVRFVGVEVAGELEVVVLVPAAPVLPAVALLAARVLYHPHAVLRVLAALLEQRGKVQVAASLPLFQFGRLPRRALQLQVLGGAKVVRLGLALLLLRDDVVLGGLPELDAEEGFGAGSICGQLAHLGTVGKQGGQLRALRGRGGGVVRERGERVREGGKRGEGAERAGVDGRGRRLVFALIGSERVLVLAGEFEAVLREWAVAVFGEVHLPSVFSFIITSPYNLPIKQPILTQQSNYNHQDLQANPSRCRSRSLLSF